MEIEKYKILETDFNGKGVSAQPNPMQKPEEEAKAVFDQLVKEVVTPKFNALVEALNPLDLTSDLNKPVSTAVQTALNKKVDKEYKTGSTTVYKVLSDNNFSDADKNRLYNTLALDNVNPFTPTAPTHPVTKDYVDNKVLESGKGDMAQAVYDPYGKKKDVFAHEGAKNNPHGVTAEQVGAKKATILLDVDADLNTILEEGEYTWPWWQETIKNAPVHSGFKLEVHEIGSGIFEQIYHEYKGDLTSTIYYRCGNSNGWSEWSRQFLPLTGGTLTGNLYINNILMLVQYLYSNVPFVELSAKTDANNRTTVQISHDPNKINATRVVRVENGTTTGYKIFGEHNKPSGSYTGTSNTTEYTINTGGIGNLLFLSSEYAFGWVMPHGAVFFRGSSSSAYHFASGIKYENGVLTISNSSTYFNSSSYEYTWRCV